MTNLRIYIILIRQDMNERYERNIGAITQAEQELLKIKRVAIIGCGGLGCYIAELLARLGLGHLTLVDGDVYAASNLNRQLYSLETNLGINKTSETRERLLKIRSDLSIKTFDIILNEENSRTILKDHDLIIDALDNVKTRLLVEKIANELGTVLVHGAVKEWFAQISTVFPGDFTLSTLYQSDLELERPSVLAFTPAFCATIQVSEALKVLLNKDNLLRRKLFFADLRNGSFEIIDL